MNLKSYLEALPKSERVPFRERLARAHSRPVATIYKWVEQCRHPATDESMRITEEVTGFMVSRFDERPDVFSVKGVIDALSQVGYEINGNSVNNENLKHGN